MELKHQSPEKAASSAAISSLRIVMIALFSSLALIVVAGLVAELR